MLNYAFNIRKTSPTAHHIIHQCGFDSMYEGGHLFLSESQHAEQRALRLSKSQADTAVICRKTLNNELANARPCQICMEALRRQGIRKVYFSTEHGFEELRL